jgi:hypothetical protein
VIVSAGCAQLSSRPLPRLWLQLAAYARSAAARTWNVPGPGHPWPRGSHANTRREAARPRRSRAGARLRHDSGSDRYPPAVQEVGAGRPGVYRIPRFRPDLGAAPVGRCPLRWRRRRRLPPVGGRPVADPRVPARPDRGHPERGASVRNPRPGLHDSRFLPAHQVRTVRAIPATCPERTLLDLCGCVHRLRAERAWTTASPWVPRPSEGCG